MGRLVLATRAQVDRITRETHALWGAGLSYAAYRDLWEELGRSAWATKYARYYVWEDDDRRVLASAKLYRPLLRVGEWQGRCAVLGAVFTPSRLRRRGYATETVRAVLEQSESEGDRAALLFSDIGTRYYTRFGFRPLPAREQLGRLPPASALLAAGLTCAPARAEDLERLRQAHLASSAHRSIAIVRDAEHWEFLWTRSCAYFSRAASQAIQHDWRVVYRGKAFAGYLIAIVAGGEWSVREVGSAEGDPGTMIEILRLGGALAYRSGARRVYAWLPGEVARGLEDFKLRDVPRRRAIPMVRLADPAVDRALARDADQAYVPFQDQF